MTTPYTTTLLDLVQTVSEFATTDNEIVATVAHLINSGTVRLGGTFSGARIDLSPRTRMTFSFPSPVLRAQQSGAL